MKISAEGFNRFVNRWLQSEEDFESFFSILKKSLLFFQKNFATIFSFFFLLLIIPNILGLIIQRILFSIVSYTSSPIAFALTVLFFTLVALFVSILSFMVNFGSCYLIYTLDEGRHESFQKLLLHILKRKKTVFVSILISFFVIFGGFSALIVPVFFLALGMVFLTHGVMIEHRNFRDAFVQSFWYSKGRKWQMFLKLLLLLLFCVFFSNAIFSLVSLIFALVPETFHNSVVFISIGKILRYSISSVFWSFIVTFVYFLWKSIKSKTTVEYDVNFKKKYIRILKIFGILGLIAIILLITISAIYAPVVGA